MQPASQQQQVLDSIYIEPPPRKAAGGKAGGTAGGKVPVAGRRAGARVGEEPPPPGDGDAPRRSPRQNCYRDLPVPATFFWLPPNIKVPPKLVGDVQRVYQHATNLVTLRRSKHPLNISMQVLVGRATARQAVSDTPPLPS